MNTYPQVELDRIPLDRNIMRLLPPEIAIQYRALPVATDGKQVTVAMAAPDDVAACLVVKSLIEAPVCLIQANPQEIDRCIHKLWPKIPESMQILSCSTLEDPEHFSDYVRNLALLLRADLRTVDAPAGGREIVPALNRAIQAFSPDLIVLQADQPGPFLRKFATCPVLRKKSWLPDLLFLPPEPILPIKKILLALFDSGDGCESAASWVLKFSNSARIEATILPVLPPTPLYYGSFLKYDLEALLNGSDLLGSRLRGIASLFEGGNVDLRFSLRDGEPVLQISEEIISSQPDLVLVPSRIVNGILNWEAPDLVRLILETILKPVMFCHQH